MSDRLFYFECPECGHNGDEEGGQLVTEEIFYCGICAGELAKTVRIRKWPANVEQLRMQQRGRE